MIVWAYIFVIAPIIIGISWSIEFGPEIIRDYIIKQFWSLAESIENNRSRPQPVVKVRGAHRRVKA